MDSTNADGQSSQFRSEPITGLTLNDDCTTTSEPVSRNQLRRAIERLLLADASLDAFCVDYFPKVHRQFSAGMEWTRKVNILLLAADPTELHERLAQYEAASSASERTLPPPRRRFVDSSRGFLYQWLGLLGLFGLCGAVMTAFVGGTLFQREHLRERGSPASATPGSSPFPPAASARARVPWLTSEPSAALVYSVPSGRLLGQTPWVPSADAPWESPRTSRMRVCVRRPGFVPVLATLEPDPSGVSVVPVHLRLQSQARAASGREPNQEACNVPAPIPE